MGRRPIPVFTIVIIVLAVLAVYATHESGSGSKDRATYLVSPGANQLDLDVLLPFSGAEIAAAASLARRFVVAYGTRASGEDPRTYLRRLDPMLHPSLRTAIEQTAPGARHQSPVTTRQASVEAVRAVEPASVIFVIAATPQEDRSASRRVRYAVTTIIDWRRRWAVYAVERADTGQSGERS